MGLEFGIATTAAEIEAVQRLRYAVYVEEMGRYRDVDGADDSRFAEPEDQNSWIVFARDGADMVAASRTTGAVMGSHRVRSSNTNWHPSSRRSRPR